MLYLTVTQLLLRGSDTKSAFITPLSSQVIFLPQPSLVPLLPCFHKKGYLKPRFGMSCSNFWQGSQPLSYKFLVEAIEFLPQPVCILPYSTVFQQPAVLDHWLAPAHPRYTQSL